MNLAIHQSSFLPYIGYWNKLANSDVFFDLGSFQFSPNEMYHRTYIRTESELKYLTVPVVRKPVLPISETLLHPTEITRFKESFKNHLRWYKKNVTCYHWKNVNDLLISTLEQEQKTLFEINTQFIDAIANYLSIPTIIIRSIDYNTELHKSELLVDIIRSYTKEPCVYLSGSGGRNYIDTKIFKDIEVQFPSSTDDFYTGSIIDYLFKYSPEECLHIIKNQFKWSKD